ncbi:hypothetical protein P4S72_21135 [Vibrio sp. PP-XX7]
MILAYSNESEWQTFRNNKNNEAFLDRVYIVKVLIAYVFPMKLKSIRNSWIIVNFLLHLVHLARCRNAGTI